MTLTTTETIATLVGDGVTTLIPVPYAFFAAADLEVVDRTDATGAEAVLALVTDFAVAGGGGGTGSVTLAAPSVSGHTYVVRRVTARIQQTDYVENSAFPADSHEQALDRAMMIAQETDRDANDGLRFAKSDPEASKDRLPSSVDRKGRLLSFDATTGKPEAVNAMTDVTAVAGVASEIVALTGIAGEIATVAGIGSAVSAVAAIDADISAVASLSETVSQVAAIDNEVATVAGIAADVAAVAANETNIGAVAAAVSGGGLTLTDTDDGTGEGPALTLYRNSSNAADDDLTGVIRFVGKNDAGTPEDTVYGTIAGIIEDVTDGTEDGGYTFNAMVAGTLTEIFRFSGRAAANQAQFLLGKTDAAEAVQGIQYVLGTFLGVCRSGGHTLTLNRLSNDGKLIIFKKDTVEEGDISVSGTTLSLTGAHLSRLSQMDGDAPPRGTVMESVNEMCAWDGETNEQLTKCMVSCTLASRSVCGVFSHIDYDDELRDCNLAQSGDFIIRVTGPCAKGDLLESNGDGTARVQADDIRRASTIAKVMFSFTEAAVDEVNTVPCLVMCG